MVTSETSVVVLRHYKQTESQNHWSSDPQIHLWTRGIQRLVITEVFRERNRFCWFGSILQHIGFEIKQYLWMLAFILTWNSSTMTKLHCDSAQLIVWWTQTTTKKDPIFHSLPVMGSSHADSFGFIFPGFHISVSDICLQPNTKETVAA